MNHIPLTLFSQLKAENGRGTNRTRHCEVQGCSETTREGKPYCPDHVDHHPYVQEILATLASKEEEEDKAQIGRLKSVDQDSLTVQEILRYLTYNGARTKERLARDVNIAVKVMDGYVRALLKAGFIELGETKRGNTIIKLSPAYKQAQGIPTPPPKPVPGKTGGKKPAAAKPKRNKSPAANKPPSPPAGPSADANAGAA